MKKFIVLLLALALLTLAGCKCQHEWEDATCLEPQICAECQETQGEPLGHSWKEASCTAPKTCSACGETEGEALSHTWAEATCTVAKTCSVCNATDGEALGHSWADATYDAPKTCSVCAETQGEPLVRTDLGMTAEDMANNMNLVLNVLGYQLEYLGIDEDGWPTYDVLDANGSYTKVYLALEPNQDASKVYALFVAAEDVNDTNAVTLMGIVAGVGLSMVDENFDTDHMSQVFAGEPLVENGVAYYIAQSCGLIAEMQVHSEHAVFWVYPAE